MLNVNDVLALVAAHKWIALSALIIGFIVRMLKDDTALPTIKARWRPWAAMGLGIVSGVLEKVAEGTAWKTALLGGLVAAIAAIVTHDLVIEGLFGGKELPVWPKNSAPPAPPADDARKAPTVPPPPPKPPTVDRRALAFASCLLLASGCALLSPKGALLSLDIARCVVANVDLEPAQIALKCGTQLTPEVLDFIMTSKKEHADAVAKAKAETKAEQETLFASKACDAGKPADAGADR